MQSSALRHTTSIPVKLSQKTLPLIKPPTTLPTYPRNKLTPGILHFGVGNFQRAHQARYLHNLFEKNLDYDWAIIGAGTLTSELPNYTSLNNQDCLYTLVEQSAHQSTSTVIGSIIDYLPPANAQAILEKLSDPTIRIVSLTITEGGYFLDAHTGLFDPTHQHILHDIASYNHTLPKTVFGLLVSALRHRRDNAIPPFTVMSCDNIPHNGVVARNAVFGLAQLCDPPLAQWITHNVAFPNSMVDRITPVTSDRERQTVRDNFNIADHLPVFCEQFTQWVLEDNFPTGRPTLDAVGVEFVQDVTPFEAMKIRILNGGHATIAYPAALLGIHLAHEAMQDSLIKAFLLKVENDEIIPHVQPVPGRDLSEYLRQICDRFENPKIGDTVRRLCLDGSNRQPKFIVPSIRDHIAADGHANGLALVSALWCRYCYGTSEDGTSIHSNDPRWNDLNHSATKAKDTPIVWLQQKNIYGTLSHTESFADTFSKWLNKIWRDGTRASLESYLKS